LHHRATFLGAMVQVEVELLRGGPTLRALVPARHADRVRLAPGRKVRVRVRAGRVSPATPPRGHPALA
jgi:hypothetical protein